MKQLLCLLIITFVSSTLIVAGAADQKETDASATLFINREFYSAFVKISPVKRDDYFESRLDTRIMARARIVSIDGMGRYKKKYRMTLEDLDAAGSGLTLRYYVFVDKQENIEPLQADIIYEFSGQLMGFTPLAMDRKSYLLDVLLEQGAIIVQ